MTATTERPIAVIGAGLVGLATAYKLTRLAPGRPVVVLEKEAETVEDQRGLDVGARREERRAPRRQLVDERAELLGVDAGRRTEVRDLDPRGDARDGWALT